MITVRKEKDGFIIYSSKQKRYYQISNMLETQLMHAVANVMDESKWDQDLSDEMVRDELSKMGFGSEQLRYIDKTCITSYLSAPLEYYFDYTSNCNLRCRHCYNKNHLNEGTMDSHHIEKIIDEMYEYGIMRLHLAGGEPLMYRDKLETYLSTANKNGMVTSLATNGTLVDDRLCEILFSNNLHAVSISLDGMEEEHDAIRGVGNYQKAIAGVKKMLQSRNERNSKTLVCLKPTYDTTKGIPFFEAMIELALELSVDIIKFSNPERCLNHEMGYYSSVSGAYYDQLNKLNELREKYSDKIEIWLPTNPSNGLKKTGLSHMKGCIGAQELLAINPDGRISPCLMNDTELGNYYDDESVMNVYRYNSTVNDYKEKIVNEACDGCDVYSYCRGGCQVRKIVQNGEISGMDPYCYLKHNGKLFSDSMDHNQLIQPVNIIHSL